jgi:hypothetical protein
MPAAREKARDLKKIILLVLAGAAMGVAAGYGIGRLLKSSGPGYHLHIWPLLLFPVLGVLAIALHEAGHVVAGVISGFRFYLFVAGPLRIEREGQRLKFTLNRIPALWGGIAACAPAEQSRDPRAAMLRYTAGGPLFSVLGSLAVLPALAIRTAHADLSFVIMVFGLTSAMIGLATLIPMQMSGYTSDGGRLLMLLRNRPEGRRWTALAAVGGLALAERPKNWPAGLVEMLGDGLEPSGDAVFACLLRHSWHADRREWDQAAFWLNRGLTNIDALAPALRGSYYLPAALYEARHGGNAAKAREYYALAEKPGIHNRNDLHAPAAAVLIAEGQPDKARAELDLAVQALASKPPKVAAAMREEIEEMRAAIA